MIKPTILLVVGKKRTGKDTLAKHLVSKYGAQTFALADPIKWIAQSLVGVDTQHLEELKELEGKDALVSKVSKDCTYSIRTLLQFLGTTVCDVLGDKDTWSKALVKRLQLGHPLTVITDVRYPKEESFFRKMASDLGYDLVVVKVVRETNLTDSHKSENESEEIPFDILLENTGTVEELYTAFDRQYEYFLEHKKTKSYISTYALTRVPTANFKRMTYAEAVHVKFGGATNLFVEQSHVASSKLGKIDYTDSSQIDVFLQYLLKAKNLFMSQVVELQEGYTPQDSDTLAVYGVAPKELAGLLYSEALQRKLVGVEAKIKVVTDKLVKIDYNTTAYSVISALDHTLSFLNKARALTIYQLEEVQND